MFKGPSVAKNCLRPESAPLKKPSYTGSVCFKICRSLLHNNILSQLSVSNMSPEQK